MKNKSMFASAERSPKEVIDEGKALITSQKYFNEIFGALNGIGAVLDKNRQIVYANDEFLKSLGIASIETVLGKRPGEVVFCINANEMLSGCGTAEACSVCGAVNAIIESQRTRQKISRETRITSVADGQIKALDLKVTSAPLTIEDENFYVFTIEDISNEKKRLALEQIFFHDVLNIAGGLNGILTILKEGTDPDEERELINMSEEASRNLIEELMLHRQLNAAENGDLKVKFEKINSLEFLNSAVSKVKFHEAVSGKNILIDNGSDDQEFESDRILLQRVMINLLKNSLEATDAGGTVQTGCHRSDSEISFWVRNTSVMPKDVRMQIFQRSFSTKGTGRGIGTYSIKLLTGNYLKGKVSFSSNEQEGTIFHIELPIRQLTKDS
jgi:signal transduction histidine kinase